MGSDDLDRLRRNLEALRLNHVAERLDELIAQAGQLRLGHIGLMLRVTDAELLARTEQSVRNRVSRACFDELFSLDEYDFKKQPSIDRKQILDLAELAFVDRCEAVLFVGPSGVGKTALATALGVKACEEGYSVEFHRADRKSTRLNSSHYS